MTLTVSSLLNMFVFNNLLILFIYFILKDYKLLMHIGIKLMLFCIFLVTVRFYLPFEYSFMKPIYITKVFPPIYIFIIKTTIPFFHYNFSLIHIFVLIWICGIIYQSVKTINAYILFVKQINSYELVKEQTIIDTLDKINSIHKNKASFQIRYSNHLDVPFICRIKSPVIIIPKISLDEKDWFYILSHEISHYYNRDLFYKAFVEILCIIYWWNPFIYLLKKQFGNLQEVNIDLITTKSFDETQKIDYLNCILNIGQICNRNPSILYSYSALQNQKPSILSQRVKIVMGTIDCAKPTLQILTVISTILITFITCSFCLIFEPSAIPAHDAENTFEINDYDAYYLIKNNEKYDLYFNSTYVGTVQSKFDPNLKVYQSIEEVPNEN